MTHKQEHLSWLGYQVRDVVTGYVGVVSSISFDLYGCVQAIVTPPLDKDGNRRDGSWFDISRLERTSATPVMTVPSNAQFSLEPAATPGPDNKPSKY
jgi:hypothetical protein